MGIENRQEYGNLPAFLIEVEIFECFLYRYDRAIGRRYEGQLIVGDTTGRIAEEIGKIQCQYSRQYGYIGAEEMPGQYSQQGRYQDKYLTVFYNKRFFHVTTAPFMSGHRI